MSDKEKKELISKILNMYAFAQAFSSVDLKDVSDIKLNADNTNPDIIDIHYRLVDKSSVEISHQHSSNMFRILYSDIRKEYGRM